MILPTLFVSLILSFTFPDPVYADITMYTALETCIPSECTMANMERPVVDRSVACPREIPFGTMIYIEDVGLRLCEDRTALRYNGRYDLFGGYTEQDYEDAINFGKQNKLIWIYESEQITR